MCEFQRASIWKRISAALFDFILLSIVVTGVACLISLALNYDAKSNDYQSFVKSYEDKYGITAIEEELTKLEESYNEKYKLTEFDEEKLSKEDKATYDDAEARLEKANKELWGFKSDEEEISGDKEFLEGEANRSIVLVNYTFIIISFSILSGFLIVEFLFPMIFKNGQTLGKKIFGVAVMRIDGVKVTPLLMFIRTVLGKYTVETMVIVFALLTIGFAPASTLIALIVIAAILIMQLVLLIVTKARTPIHDKLASTVTVDFATQMIFDSQEEMIAFKKRIHEEQVEAEKNTD